MACSWDEWQTPVQEEDDCLAAGGSPSHGSSPFHEEDFEHEDESPSRRTKSDQNWCNGDEVPSSKEEDPEERVMEEETSKVQAESVKFICTGNSASASKGAPTTMNGCTIHESLDGTYQEKSKRRNAVKKFTIGARISVKPSEGWRKKYLIDTNYMPKQHPLGLDNRIRRLEVYANGSPLHREHFLRECIRQLEKKIAKDTTSTLNACLLLIANLEKKVEIFKHRISALEKTNELLCQALARSVAPASEKNNRGTDN